jgi:glucose dehydrogenase
LLVGRLSALSLSYPLINRICASAQLGSRQAQVDAPAVANPAAYVYKGKQYVVFVAGGNAILKAQASDQVAAFALR